MSRPRTRWSWLGALVLGGAGCVGFPPPFGGGDESTSGGSSTGGPFDPTLPGNEVTTGGEPMTSSSSSGGSSSSGMASSSGDSAPSCCEAHDEPGCDDDGIVDCVCAQDPECCDGPWSDNCVVNAVRSCGADCGEPTTGGSTGEPGECVGPVEIDLLPVDAVLTGGWSVMLSELGEGEIAVYDESERLRGSVTYQAEIPCDDTFYLWVRYWEQGDADSYFVALDAEPEPPAIFEADCTPMGNGWGWSLLNWRDQDEPLCTYVEDPWAPQWEAGTHTIEFTYRESLGLGRVIVTNDPMFIPPNPVPPK